MGSWFKAHKNKPQEIIAIDIGTASVSAVLARKNINGTIEIVSVLRYPFDLLGDFSRADGQKKVFYMLQGALSKTFSDMHRLSKSVDTIRISFSDPFFEEQELETTINRPEHKKAITEDEINLTLKDTGGWKVLNALNKNENQSSLVSIMREIVQLKVNGYKVDSAVGYKGKTLDIRIRELFTSSIMKDCILEQKEKFYPQAVLRYYSDPHILKQAIFATKIKQTPVLVIDIGGEVTTLFVLKDFDVTQRCSPVFFGLRALERRIAAFLKIDRAHAESILWQYAELSLEETLKKKVEPIIGAFLEDWYTGISASLKNGGVRNEIAQAIIAGSGKEAPFFIEYLNSHIKGFSYNETTMNISAFAVATNLFLPEKSLSEGGDVILASLILYG